MNKYQSSKAKTDSMTKEPITFDKLPQAVSYLTEQVEKIEEAKFHSFNVIAATFYEHYDDILNFYNNRASNAMAESFNAKIKLFRANLRGVADKKFFLFRIANLYAYPTKFLLSHTYAPCCGKVQNRSLCLLFPSPLHNN